MVRKFLVPAVLAAAIFVPVYWNYYVWDRRSDTDHASHIEFIRGHAIPMYPFFHWSVLALALGQDRWLEPAAGTVLGLASAVTAGLSGLYLSARSNRSTAVVTGVSLLLALVMPLPSIAQLLHILERLTTLKWDPGTGVYLGQICPNVWHNPTTVYAMPFAIGAFWVSVRALEDVRFKFGFAAGVMMVLTLMAKPNYVLALAPCLGLAMLEQRLPFIDKFLRLFGTLLLPGGVLLAQAAILVGPTGTPNEEMVIAPFEIWSRFSTNIPGSALVGIVFPLTVLVLYAGSFREELSVKLSWAVLGMAVLQYSVLAEAGMRSSAGNWAWGMIFADHILFLASSEFLLRQRTTWRQVACFVVLFLHAASGAINLARCMRQPHLSLFF